MRGIRSRVFITVSLVYLFYIAPGYVTANTNRYILLTKVIADDRTFAIDKYYVVERNIVEYTRDWSRYKEHFYIGAAPGLGIMAVPVYIALKPLGRFMSPDIYQALEFSILNLGFTFFLALLPGAVIAVLLYDMLNEFELKEGQRLLLAFGSSFGTALFYYSTRFMAHSMSAFMLFAAFYLLFRYKQGLDERTSPAFLAGVLLGSAILVDYIMVVGVALVLAYYLMNFRRGEFIKYIFLTFGFALAASVYMYYHYKCFGRPFAMASAYSQMIGPHALSRPNPKTVFELAFGVYRGLFAYMPVTLLSIYGIIVFFKGKEQRFKQEMILISLLFVFVFLLISSYTEWDGGGSFGPRYFVPFLPFLIIPVAFVFKRLSYKIAFGITALSVFINWCGVQYGDADSVFTNVLLFLFGGLNSNLAEWTYGIASAYIRRFNVITHFSPFAGFMILLTMLYLIWRPKRRRL